MHDLRNIRDDLDAFNHGLLRRGEASSGSQVLELDDKRRVLQQQLQSKQKRRNELSKAIGIAKQQDDKVEIERLLLEVSDLKNSIHIDEEKERKLLQALNELLSCLPNIPAPDVPDGFQEVDNVEIRRWGEENNFSFAPKDHVDIGEQLGLMEFEITASMSGARFVTLKGKLALLERALGAFMLDIQTSENGYTEVSPPLLVRDQGPFGVGQLPKFSGDLFQTTEGMWLISTGEVPLTNLVRDQILEVSDLPMRFAALTPCFRSEAGAAGKDTRGMLRMHQFYKVEIVSIVHPKESEAEHERLTNCAEIVLQRLDLPYRVVSLCAGDMGFAARRTYDLEVWLPSQGLYREISSCSLFGDFQARRMNARFRSEGKKKTDFVHTLNGSGLAVGRALVAILENCQQADGSISIPKPLVPYMGGIDIIPVNG